MVCDQYLRRRVAGVFFAPFEHYPDKEPLNREMAERLHLAGIAVVLLDRDLVPFPARSNFDVVGIDNVAGGYLVTEHLLKLGCQRPVFLNRPRSAPTVYARAAGFREALMAHGIEVSPGHRCEGEPDDPTFVRSLVKDNRPDAIVCANDQTAATLIRTLNQAKVRVPEDVRVTGFDDVKYATLVSTPLTTIHQPCRDLAEVAFRAMTERISEPTIPPRIINVSPTLIVRESCGAYKKRPALS
jgi:LacI family transcriptional regulator